LRLESLQVAEPTNMLDLNKIKEIQIE